MQKVLNLSEITRDNPFSFDNTVEKRTESGLVFKTYRGLRMYLITGALDRGWLRASYEGEFLIMQQKNMPFIYCKNLKLELAGALRRFIDTRPMIGLIANRKTQVITNSTVPAEIEWASIVQEVVKGL